ncbi:MAG: hypothetical protein QOF74_344, partial [Caballeronia mineralivorans]|nr:hypothetical protein [Caballeronia mineralivorans]
MSLPARISLASSDHVLLTNYLGDLANLVTAIGMDLSQHAFQNINLLGREALHRTFEHADKYLGHAISEFAPSASQFKPYDTPVTT